MSKNAAVFILGPTGVGKTALSISVAKKIEAEIISCDSMQVYKHMDIGTAKVSDAEKQGVIHHMIDIAEPTDTFSAFDYAVSARRAAEDISKRGLIPLVVGGTGLYAAALEGKIDFDDGAGSDAVYRESLYGLAREKGKLFVHELLEKIDEKSARTIHPNNLKRVIRALEYYKATGIPISVHNEETKKAEPLFSACKIGLVRSREKLYERIDKRADKMLSDGLLDEVKALLAAGCGAENTSMQALGYREAAQYLGGGLTYDEMVGLIKRNSRRYAKRQLTWFRRDGEIQWINLDEMPPEDALGEALNRIAQFYRKL